MRYTAPHAVFLGLLISPASINLAYAQAEMKAQPLFEQQTLFKSGDRGYHTYRIPALVVTTRGTVLAFCEARKKSRSDHGDIDLVLRRSDNGGKSWGPVQTLADDGDRTMGNACPVVDRNTGTIWLPFCRDNKQVLLMKSDDDGNTWSKPIEITKDVKDPAWYWLGTGPGHGIQLRTGRLLIPCWADAKPRVGDVQLSYAFYSDDAGKSWKRGNTLDRDASDECEAVELADGRLYMTLRSRQGKHQRGYAFSNDGGHNWTVVKYDPRLPEPSCQGSVIRFTSAKQDGQNRILLAAPAKPEARTHLTVYLSLDECQNWATSKVVREGPAAYSDLAVTTAREVLLLYEADEYSRLTLARFNLAWITSGTQRSVIMGTITFNGKPIEKAAVVLYLIDGMDRRGAGFTAAARVTKGKYQIEKIKPGEYEIVIVAKEFKPEWVENDPQLRVKVQPGIMKYDIKLTGPTQ